MTEAFHTPDRNSEGRIDYVEYDVEYFVNDRRIRFWAGTTQEDAETALHRRITNLKREEVARARVIKVITTHTDEPQPWREYASDKEK